MLDWDLAGPGDRMWDLASAAYFWGQPFTDHSQAALAEKVRRIELYLDAYGLDDHGDFWPTLELRLTFVADFVDAEARRSDPGMQRLTGWGIPRKMREEEVECARRLRAVQTLQRVLCRTHARLPRKLISTGQRRTPGRRGC